MITESSPQRLSAKTVDELRDIERTEKRKASINGTVGYLVKFHKLTKKLDKELYQKIKFTLN